MTAARAWRPAWRGSVSLGAKLVLLLSAAGLAGAVAITLLLATVITPSFNRLEAAAVDGDAQRAVAVLADICAGVETAARDRAARGADRTAPAIEAPAIEGVARVDDRGRVVASDWRDARSGARSPAMRARLVAALKHVDLTMGPAGGRPARCYLRLGATIAAIGVAPARGVDGVGAPSGHVVLARMVTDADLGALLQREARIGVPAGDRVGVVPRGRALTEVSIPLAGPDGRAVAAVRFDVRREVSLLGRRMLLLAVAGSTLLLLIVLMVLRRLIGRQVLAPLHRVEAHMQRVRASGSLSPLDEDGRRDEIGSLGRSFNAMLRQLHDLREQIEVQSFALGRTDSAVAVMHNVRNALTPVSTILSQGVAQPPPVGRAMLDRAVAELAVDDMPAARRHQLAAFVAAGVAAWDDSRAAMREELTVGREAMAHALEIIGQQQQRAHERPPLETCDVGEIIARNATIARYSGTAAITFSFPPARHPVLANRVILSQVIGNLFGNAVEAIAARGGGTGAITVTVDERDGTVEVRIRDDGEGFDDKAGTALFQRGFSTRRHKSGGLGLHWCANSMTAMDGSLRLESEGAGRGAVAILMLRAAAPSTHLPLPAAA